MLQNANKINRKKKLRWYFLYAIILIYIIISIINADKIIETLHILLTILLKLIPVFIIVFIIMVFVDLFLNSKIILKYMGEESGIKKWIIAVIFGILSSGPIYMWYPLLKELQNKGIKNGLLATFLYNRAIKLPLIPILLTYFSLSYIIILTMLMVIASVLQGLFINKITY